MMVILYGLLFSYLSDFLLSKLYISKSVLRYLSAGLSLGLPGITVAVLGYTTNSWIMCILVLSIGNGFKATAYMGHLGAIYDIAPTYAGTVYGIVNTVGNTTGFITPLIAAALTEYNIHDIEGWRNLFWLSSGIYFSAFVIFPICVRLSPAPFEVVNWLNYEEIRDYGSTGKNEHEGGDI